MRKFLALCLTILICMMLASCKSTDYKEANNLLSQGNYSDALVMFESLGEYKDCVEKTKECKYMLARILLCLDSDPNNDSGLPPAVDVYDSYASSKDIASAEVLLESIGDYKDSYLLLDKLANIQEFNKAVSMFEDGNFEDAMPVFEKFIDIDSFHAQRYISAIEVFSKVSGTWSGKLSGDIDYRDYISTQLSNGTISCEIGPPYSIGTSWFSDCDWVANATVEIEAGYYVIKCGFSGNNLSYKTFYRTLEEGFHHPQKNEKDELDSKIYIENKDPYNLLFPSKSGIYSRIFISFNKNFSQMTIMELPFDINWSMSYQSEAYSVNLTKEK